jgi:hypothetical protein
MLITESRVNAAKALFFIDKIKSLPPLSVQCSVGIIVKTHQLVPDKTQPTDGVPATNQRQDETVKSAHLNSSIATL